MAKAPTTQTNPAQDDVLPEIDDEVEVSSTGDYVEEGKGDDEEIAKVSATDKPESPREAAVRKYREMRQKAEQSASGNDDADETDEISDHDQDEEEGDEPEAAPAVAAKAAPVASPAPAADPEVELKVNGATVRMKQSEALAQAQIALASKGILDEVKALREEARAQRGRSVDPANQSDDDDDLNVQDDRSTGDKAKANQPKPSFDAEKLENIVERIQIGDKDEGRQALADLIEIVSSSAGNKNDTFKPEEIGRVVNEQLARARIAGEIEQAGAAFKGKYGEIVSDPDMLDMTFTRLGHEVRQDLLSAGIKDAEKASQERLLELHTQARIQGLPVRSIQAHFDKVGQDVSAKFAPLLGSKTADPDPTPSRQSKPQQPAPSTRVAERLDRKRSAQVQPRTAGMRAAPESAQKPKTRQEIVAEMRRSRGYSA